MSNMALARPEERPQSEQRDSHAATQHSLSLCQPVLVWLLTSCAALLLHAGCTLGLWRSSQSQCRCCVTILIKQNPAKPRATEKIRETADPNHHGIVCALQHPLATARLPSKHITTAVEFEQRGNECFVSWRGWQLLPMSAHPVPFSSSCKAPKAPSCCCPSPTWLLNCQRSRSIKVIDKFMRAHRTPALRPATTAATYHCLPCAQCAGPSFHSPPAAVRSVVSDCWDPSECEKGKGKGVTGCLGGPAICLRSSYPAPDSTHRFSVLALSDTAVDPQQPLRAATHFFLNTPDSLPPPPHLRNGTIAAWLPSRPPPRLHYHHPPGLSPLPDMPMRPSISDCRMSLRRRSPSPSS